MAEPEEELQVLVEQSSAFLCGLAKKEIEYRKLEIERILGDSDFSNIESRLSEVNPVVLISRYLDEPYLPATNSRTRSEWFACLGLYLASNPDLFEFGPKTTDFIRLAIAQAENAANRARIEEFGENTEKREIAKTLNQRKHAATNLLREKALQEYEPARQKLINTGAKVTYKEIGRLVWRNIRKFNRGSFGDPIIAKSDPEGFTPAVQRVLTRWFSQAVKEGRLEPIR